MEGFHFGFVRLHIAVGKAAVKKLNFDFARDKFRARRKGVLIAVGGWIRIRVGEQCGRIVEAKQRPVGQAQTELIVGIHDAIAVDRAPILGEVAHVHVTAAAKRFQADGRTVCRFCQIGHRQRRVVRVGEVELHRLAVAILELHLELALNYQEAKLIRDVGEEQDGCVSLGDFRQVGIQLRVRTQCAVEEVEFARCEELAIRAQSQLDLTIERILRCVLRVDLGAGGNRHRLGERRQKARSVRIGLNRQVLIHDLVLDRGQPQIRVDLGNRFQGRVAQLLRLGQHRQRLEEFDTCHEVVNRQAGSRLQQNSRRRGGRQHHAQRPEFGKGHLQAESADACHGESGVQSNKQDAIFDRCRRVVGRKDVPVAVESHNATQQ